MAAYNVTVTVTWGAAAHHFPLLHTACPAPFCYPLVEGRWLGLAVVEGLAGHAATPRVVARGR